MELSRDKQVVKLQREISTWNKQQIYLYFCSKYCSCLPFIKLMNAFAVVLPKQLDAVMKTVRMFVSLDLSNVEQK